MTIRRMNELQSAILFDDAEMLDVDAFIMRNIEAFRSVAGPLAGPQERVASGVMMGSGHDGLFVTIEFLPHQADAAVFAPTLQSPFTQISYPEGAARLGRHRSHALVTVRHGIMPDMPEVRGFVDNLELAQPGNTFEDFDLRVRLLATISERLVAERNASTVHWTPSNTLLYANSFSADQLARHPSPLMVHPRLFGAPVVEGFAEVPAGFFSLGASNYLGREIHVTAAPVPWSEQFQAALAFIAVTLDRGAPYPDGDTFSDPDQTVLYRVNHVDSGDDMLPEPHFRLTLERSETHGYVAGGRTAASKATTVPTSDGKVVRGLFGRFRR